MKLEFIKLKEVKHSGTGDNATHIKVMQEFENDFEEGKRYCKIRGWRVIFSDNLLSVLSNSPFGFTLIALAEIKN